MKEPQLKQINKSNSKELKQINNSKQEENKVKQEKYQTIKELPSWSIEPPLEIKRGN